MSNVHNIHQSRNTKSGPYNPYFNEGFSPISTQTNQNNFNTAQIKPLIKFIVTQFSFWILVLQFLVFVSSYIYFYSSEESWTCILLNLGAKYEPKIKYHYEFFRLIIPIILHGGLTHFFSNFITQIFLNFILEKEYGKKKFITLFFMSGIGGNLTSCVMYPDTISVGASSALFGILALYGCFLMQNYSQMGDNKNIKLLIYGLILFGNFSMFFTNKEGQMIDLGAHLGYFLKKILYFINFRWFYCWSNFSCCFLFSK